MASGLDITTFVDSVLTARREQSSPPPWFGATKSGLDRPDYPDPMSRMFSTDAGQLSARIVGNESRTLSILSDLATEALVEGTGGGRSIDQLTPDDLSEETSVLVLDRGEGASSAPAVLMLDPHLPDGFQPYRVDWKPGYVAYEKSGMDVLQKVATTTAQQVALPERREVARALLEGGPDALVDVLWIVRPDVVIARHPEMELVGCPSPALEIRSSPPGKPVESSSVGLFCRDSDGVLGVTACHHGTGPAGTPVTIGGLPSVVKLADVVQDIVFLPLPDGYAMPNYARGLNGPRSNRPPFQGEQVEFEGRTTGHKATVVNSHSPGLLSLDFLSQNKVHTPAAVNKGDSGSALVDGEDYVIGFAFRRTKTGEPLEFAEWIWAANAMAALGLTLL